MESSALREASVVYTSILPEEEVAGCRRARGQDGEERVLWGGPAAAATALKLSDCDYLHNVEPAETPA